MSELQQGKLKVTPRKKGSPLIQVDIGGKLFNVAQGQLSSDIAPEDGMEVEFEREAGQPRRIRRHGQPFVSPGASESSSSHQTGSGRKSEQRGRQQGKRSSRQTNNQREETTMPNSRPRRNANRERSFHNPYNFIPAPPRNTNHPELGDHEPVAQDSYHADRYSGCIRVKMVVETPLSIPDVEKMQEDENGHKTFPLRVDDAGLPIVPSSGIRGMLRSAYEAVTNSRFGRFSKKHRDRHQYRQSRPPYAKVNYPVSPLDMLDRTLRPARTISELSPADRVFGWVLADGQGNANTRQSTVARRGLLRIGPVHCESTKEEAVESFDPPGVPLAILAQPNPQQGRFYVAKSPNGEAQDDGLSKVDAGYQQGKGLRGRKVYPHHAGLPHNHWNDPQEDRTQRSNNGHYQEYRRPRQDGNEQRDDQNRSILGWVNPGATLSFDIHVENLSLVELGALLWLLSLPEKHYFRFGGGKPLGFGSVRLSITHCDVCAGADLRQRYLQWNPTTHQIDRDAAIGAFQCAVVDAYGSAADSEAQPAFKNVSFVAAFLAASRGFVDAKPVHYPRATNDGSHGPPNPAGESFKWFVANENDQAQYALPGITEQSDNIPLPTLQERGRRGGGRRGRGRGGQGTNRNRRNRNR